MTPDVTIVVCTYNRAEMLGGALDSLMALRSEGQFAHEILVVDNASTDATASVARQAAARSPVPLRVVCEPRPGVPFARNRGVREARGRWIAFFDDDQLADPDWLSSLWALATDRRCRCVAGAVRLALPEPRLKTLPWICRNLFGESPACHHPRRLDGRLRAGAGNLLLCRDVLDEVGGFDERIQGAGEDSDLLDRLRAAGIEIWFAPAAIVRHLIPEERLQNEHLARVSRRIGIEVARRDRGRRPWAAPFMLAARLAHAALRIVPAAVHGWVLGSPRGRLYVRCLAWRMGGYVAQMLHELGLRSANPAEAVNFRQERDACDPARGTPAKST